MALELGSTNVTAAADLYVWLREQPQWDERYLTRWLTRGTADQRAALKAVWLWALANGRQSGTIRFAGIELVQQGSLPVERVIAGLETTTDPGVFQSWYDVLTASSAQLDAAAARTLAERAAERASAALATATDSNVIWAWGRVLEASAARLDPTIAESIAMRLVNLERPGYTEDAEYQIARTRAIAALTFRVPPVEAESLCSRSLNSLPNWSVYDKDLMPEAAGVIAFARSPATVAAILKHPQCVKQGQDAALRRLDEVAFPPTPTEQTFRLQTSLISGLVEPTALAPLAAGAIVQRDRTRRFRNVWDAVAWLREHHPEIDLDAPYKPRV